MFCKGKQIIHRIGLDSRTRERRRGNERIENLIRICFCVLLWFSLAFFPLSIRFAFTVPFCKPFCLILCNAVHIII